MAEPGTVIILAAGLGKRLGRAQPKPLTPLRDGRTILRRQLDEIATAFSRPPTIQIVVGFAKEQVMTAAAGEASFVYNEKFERTNTAKSLLRALRVAPPGDVLWLNGDVVFESGLLHHLLRHIDGGPFVAVVHGPVGAEEVKFTIGASGHVQELSKQVEGALGEAVGINYVDAASRNILVRHLDRVGDPDYFEKAVEDAIAQSGLRVRAVDVAPFDVVEVDFGEDLERANAL